MWGGGGRKGGEGGLMPPPQGFVNEARKGWMPPPSDFANFEKEIYFVAETLSSCSFIACGFFDVSTVPKIRHFKHNSSSFSTRHTTSETSKIYCHLAAQAKGFAPHVNLFYCD